jgi:hypothetical protein
MGIHGFEAEAIAERLLGLEAGRSPRPSHNDIESLTHKDENGDG